MVPQLTVTPVHRPALYLAVNETRCVLQFKGEFDWCQALHTLLTAASCMQGGCTEERQQPCQKTCAHGSHIVCVTAPSFASQLVCLTVHWRPTTSATCAWLISVWLATLPTARFRASLHPTAVSSVQCATTSPQASSLPQATSSCSTHSLSPPEAVWQPSSLFQLPSMRPVWQTSLAPPQLAAPAAIAWRRLVLLWLNTPERRALQHWQAPLGPTVLPLTPSSRHSCAARCRHTSQPAPLATWVVVRVGCAWGLVCATAHMVPPAQPKWQSAPTTSQSRPQRWIPAQVSLWRSVMAVMLSNQGPHPMIAPPLTLCRVMCCCVVALCCSRGCSWW